MPGSFVRIIALFSSLALPAPLVAIDVYYQAVHQESSIKPQPPATFDRILGLYLSDRSRPFKLPEPEGPKDLFQLEKTLHLKLYSEKTQDSLDRTSRETTALQVAEAFVQTVALNPNQFRLGKFISQLQGDIYPITPYGPAFVTPPLFRLTSFGAEGLTGIGFEWVRFIPALFTFDITYQFMRSDHPLFAGPQQNGNFHSLGLNYFGELSEASTYGIALKAGGQALGSEQEVRMWTAELNYNLGLVQGRGISAKAEFFAEEAKVRQNSRVRGGYLAQMLVQLNPMVSFGLRRDASGLQAEGFDHVIRDAVVATLWLSKDVALDGQKSFVNPKNSSAFNQSHLQLRLSLLKI